MATVKPKKQLSFACLSDTLEALKNAVDNDTITNILLPDDEGQLKDYSAYLLTGNVDYFPQEWPEQMKDFADWTYRGRLVRAAMCLLMAGYRLDQQDEPAQNPKNINSGLPEKFEMGKAFTIDSYKFAGVDYIRESKEKATYWRKDIYAQKFAGVKPEPDMPNPVAGKGLAEQLEEAINNIKPLSEGKAQYQNKYGYWEGNVWHKYPAVQEEQKPINEAKAHESITESYERARWEYAEKLTDAEMSKLKTMYTGTGISYTDSDKWMWEAPTYNTELNAIVTKGQAVQANEVVEELGKQIK